MPPVFFVRWCVCVVLNFNMSPLKMYFLLAQLFPFDSSQIKTPLTIMLPPPPFLSNFKIGNMSFCEPYFLLALPPLLTAELL